MASDRLNPKFQTKAVAMPTIIMAIAVGGETGCCPTLKTSRGPNPEANADQEKVTKAKTLLPTVRAIAKITAVMVKVPTFAHL